MKVDFAAPQVHDEAGVSLLQQKTVHVEVNCWSNGVTGTVHSDPSMDDLGTGPLFWYTSSVFPSWELEHAPV